MDVHVPVVLSNSTKTNAAEIDKKNLRVLMRIEAYVGITAILLAFLVLFGSCRRRFHNPFFKFSIWTAYTLSFSLMSYTMGQMQSVSFKNELFAIWAMFCLLVLGSANSISAYSLQDNENYIRYNFEVLVQFFWLVFILGMYNEETKFQIPLYVLYLLTLRRTSERAGALASASRSNGVVRNTKLITDYMAYEHEHALSEDGEVDPTCMKGYNYLVTGEKNPPNGDDCLKQRLDIKEDNVITIHKIWQCKGRLLSPTHDPDQRLKDLGLSYALYRLLRRRFAWFSLKESDQEKTWNFVRYGLLNEKGGGDDDHERSFRVIEVELSFLYDSFYTNYPVIFKDGFPKSIIIWLIIVAFGCWIAANILINYDIPNGCVNLLTVSGRNVDVLVTFMVIISIMFLEIAQFVGICFSDWAKVILLCKYVQNLSWQRSGSRMEKIVEIICRPPRLKPWERKLGQYSLIDSFGHKPFKLFYNSMTSSYIEQERDGQKASTPIKLTKEVKKAVILSLKTNEKILKNGTASLHRNGVANQLDWACRLKTQTHVIMVWHFATSYCELSSAQTIISSPNEQIERERFKGVANALSKYCAYLVAFKPRLLPGHAYDSECTFDQVVSQTRSVLKGCKDPNSKYEKLKKLGESDTEEENTVKRGTVLGKMLVDEIQDQVRLWKVLAEFWAETMLFVAPSEDSTAHAENLATGGEFVTHLWALLTHAGILQRSESAAVPEA